MAIVAIYNLEDEIHQLAMTGEMSDYKEIFKRNLQRHIQSRKKKTAMKILERIYNNDREALRRDMESWEKEKILMLIDKDVSVEGIERKKMLALLYPMFKEEFCDFMGRLGI